MTKIHFLFKGLGIKRSLAFILTCISLWISVVKYTTETKGYEDGILSENWSTETTALTYKRAKGWIWICSTIHF